MIPLVPVNAVTPFGLDGSGMATCGAAVCTVSLTTTFANDLIKLDLWDVPGSGGGNNMSLIVPTYISPGTSCTNWAPISTAVAAHPTLKITMIINPSNGPGGSADTTYASCITTFIADGVRVIGYVHTSYASRPLATVEADVASWKSFYSNLNGIFIDEVSTSPSQVSYYTSLNTYILGQSFSGSFTMGNPGNGDPAMDGIFNTMMVWDSPGTPSVSYLQASTSPTYRRNYAIASLGMTSPSATNVTYIHNISPYVTYVYITDGANYNTLASYFSTLASNVASASGTPCGGGGHCYGIQNVVSSPALFWHQRDNASLTNGFGGDALMTFWAAAPSAHAYSINITSTVGISGALIGYGISNANTTQPFDPNITSPNEFVIFGSIPACDPPGSIMRVCTASSSTPTVNITTSNANDFITQTNFQGACACTTPTDNTGTLIASVSSAGFLASGYQVVSTVQTQAPLKFTWQANQFNLMMNDAIKEAVAPIANSTVIIPCTAFQLQCWLYPVFFLSVYLVLNIGITWRGQISTEDMEGVIFESLALGSMIAVIMGMVNIMIPLLLTVIQVVRTIRR